MIFCPDATVAAVWAGRNVVPTASTIRAAWGSGKQRFPLRRRMCSTILLKPSVPHFRTLIATVHAPIPLIEACAATFGADFHEV